MFDQGHVLDTFDPCVLHLLCVFPRLNALRLWRTKRNFEFDFPVFKNKWFKDSNMDVSNIEVALMNCTSSSNLALNEFAMSTI